MKRAILVFGLLAMGAAACATASKVTIANRLEAAGLSRENSVCMARELDDRLDDEQLAEFARFTVQVSRSDTAKGVVSELRKISNPQIASAVLRSSIACAFGQ